MRPVLPTSKPSCLLRAAANQLCACAPAVAIGVLMLTAFVWTAHPRIPINGQAVAVRLRQTHPARSRALCPAQRSSHSACAHTSGSSAPKGLIDLVGDRTPLSLDPLLARESASWAPASPWFAAHNLSASFRACEGGPETCDSLVAQEATRAVQAALWASQNPPDCRAARYLVLEKAWPYGLGSAVHAHTSMLALAVSDNRVLVAAPGLTWGFDAPDLCNHSESRRSYLDCLFLPTTACPLPRDWANRAVQMTAMNMSAEIVAAPVAPVFNFSSNPEQGMWSLSNNPVLGEIRGRSKAWWQAQLIKFVMRPSDDTLEHLAWPLQQAAFYRTEGVLPHPLAAVFIRAGDKFREAPPVSVDAHFAELAPLAEKLGIKDVYVGSDSHDRIAEALDKYRSNYTIHFIDWDRPDAGLVMGHVTRSTGSWRMSELLRLAVADIFITVQADVMVGTLSSNWARLGDEFRRANGKGVVPYLNPERPRARVAGVP